jgi:hypothetical protein
MPPATNSSAGIKLIPVRFTTQISLDNKSKRDTAAKMEFTRQTAK